LREIINKVVGLRPFPNYFGYQRFGTRRPVTHLIGKWIIRGDYSRAVEWLLGHPFHGESPKAFEARKLFDEGRWEEALRAYPPYLRLESLVAHKLVSGKNPKASIMALGRWYINFFVEAYQSFLFNLALSRALIDAGSVEAVSESCDVLPIPHPAAKVRDECDIYLREVLKEEGISEGLPGIKYMRRGIRDSSLRIGNVGSYGTGDTLTVSFVLRPSAYATIILREIFRENLKP